MALFARTEAPQPEIGVEAALLNIEVVQIDEIDADLAALGFLLSLGLRGHGEAAQCESDEQTA